MRPEHHHARLECPDVWRWSAPDVMASESEVTTFLAMLVGLLKPDHIVETGTYLGDTAEAMGRELFAEGRGHLTTLEVDADSAAQATARLIGLPVQVINAPAISWESPRPIDLLFSDSGEYRTEEIRYFAQWASPRCVIVVHDTHRDALRRELNDLTTKGVTTGWLFLPTPRGLGLSRYP